MQSVAGPRDCGCQKFGVGVECWKSRVENSWTLRSWSSTSSPPYTLNMQLQSLFLGCHKSKPDLTKMLSRFVSVSHIKRMPKTLSFDATLTKTCFSSNKYNSAQHHSCQAAFHLIPFMPTSKTGFSICLVRQQKHHHNVEMRLYCPQTFLSLDSQSRGDVPEIGVLGLRMSMLPHACWLTSLVLRHI